MQKLFVIILLLTIFNSSSISQNIGIGTNNPHPSAALEIADTSKGILIPRMTMSQRLAIQSPVEGLMIYQTDSTKGFWYWDGIHWKLNGLIKSVRKGEMLYSDGNNWVVVSPGVNGQTLTYCNGVPTWGPCPPSNPFIQTNESINKAFYGYAKCYPVGGSILSYPLGYYYYMVLFNGNPINYVDSLGNPCGTPTESAAGRIDNYPNWAPLTPRHITISASISDTSSGNSNPLEIFENGFCWSETPNPNIDNNIIYTGYGAGNISIDFSQLTENQTYYFRPFCNSNLGFFYGNQIMYTHKRITEPSITSIPTNIITSNSIRFGGEISDNYECIISERGVCWSTSPNPTISNSKTTDAIGYDGWNYPNLSGSFEHELTNLTPGNTYYIRAYETNSISSPWYTNRFNTKYGQEYTITTLSQ